MLKHSLRFLSALVLVLFCLSTGDLWAPKRAREEDSIASRVRKRRRTDGSSVATPSPPPKETDSSLAAWFAKLTKAQKRQTCPEIEQIETAFNSFIQGADLAFMLWPYRRVFKTPLQPFKEQGHPFFSSIHAQNHSVLFHHAAPRDAGHSFP